MWKSQRFSSPVTRTDLTSKGFLSWDTLLALRNSGNIWEGGSHWSHRKVDRCILELQMEAEDMYSRFRNAIENVWLGERVDTRN